MPTNVPTGTTRAFLPYVLTTVGIAWAAGCSSEHSAPDAALARTPDAALPAPAFDGSADDVGAFAETAQTVEAETPATSYCTSKPALTTVTEISGTWVIRARASQVVKAPILSTPLYPKTVLYMLVHMSQVGTDVIADGLYCDRAEIDEPGSLVMVVMPDKWAHTEKAVRRPGTLVVGNDGIPVLKLPLVAELVGAVADATGDQLPTRVDDTRVIDEDNDGHPGITINLTGMLTGSVYAVQRQTTAVAAIPVAPNRFEGNLDFTSEQKVLDSNPALITALYGQSVSYPDPALCSSTFAMVKVANDAAIDAGPGRGVNCEWVRANQAVLFAD